MPRGEGGGEWWVGEAQFFAQHDFSMRRGEGCGWEVGEHCLRSVYLCVWRVYTPITTHPHRTPTLTAHPSHSLPPPSARDPAVTLPDPIRVDVVVKDPMKKELVKTLREKQLLQSLLRGHMERDVDVVALGRLFEVDRGDRLDVAWWDKVDSTPYGYTVAEKDPGEWMVMMGIIHILFVVWLMVDSICNE